MNTIMLCAAVGLVFGIIFASRGRRSTNKYIFGTICCPVFGAIFGLFLAGAIIGAIVPMKDVVYGQGKLVAMRSTDCISGAFIWGSGNIASQTSYNFLQRLDDGSMVPRSVPADGLVRLIEDPELQNTGFWSTTWREVDMTSPLYSWSLGTRESQRVVRQEFRVPVGTVVQQFSVK
jgi:hypothetical protein